MPNYVYNKIEFKGDEVPLNKLKEKMKVIVANDSKQIMGDLLNKKSFGNDWYEHNYREYGTKWDVSIENCFKLEMNRDNVILEFDTAWNPPFIFLEETCKKYNVLANTTYDDLCGDFVGIIKIDNQGEILESEEWPYNEGMYRLNPESYLKYFEANIDHYIDQDCEFVPQSIDFLSDDDLHRVKTIIEKRSVERLFDNPLTGKCFDKKHTVHPLNSITFNGKLDELICKLTALEHNESDQVMGDILGFNSFNSNEKNRGIYGSNDDFGIDDCSISMTDNFVVINHFTKTMTPPVEFMKHVCIRYGVSGEMIIDGNTNIDASIAKSDSKGNLSIELRSVESAHDPDDFFS